MSRPEPSGRHALSSTGAPRRTATAGSLSPGLASATPSGAPIPLRARLGPRIALTLGLGALLLTGGLSWSSLRAVEGVAAQTFAKGAAQISHLAAASLGGPVKFGKTEILATELDRLKTGNGAALASAAVYGADGAPLASVGEAPPSPLLAQALKSGEEARSSDGLTLALPIRYGRDSDLVGAALLRWSDAAIQAEAQNVALLQGLFGLAAAALMTGLGLIGLSRGVTRPIAALEQAVARLTAGDSVSAPGAHRHDEIGALARAMSRIHEQGEEAMRTRRALDSSQTLLMIADNEDRIAYVTPGLVKLLHRSQDFMRRTDPSFDSAHLVGRNFHDFHRDRTHQQNMLANLSKDLKADIRLGERRLSLLVSPVHGPDGRRLGTVVEWRDRTEDLHVLEQIDETAAAVASGDFSGRVVAAADADHGLQRVAGQVNRICETIDGVLTDVERPIKAMSGGDLTLRCASGHSGRFGHMAEGVNAALDRLSDLIARAKDAERRMREDIDHVSSGAGDLSGRTEAQASALEETSATVEQISATIATNADGAREASRLAGDARDRASKGQSVAGQAVESMTEIERSSDRIADITAVIDAIAFQTNLLALNAAVEAARAGEAGKGFAVVASEVRTLAQRSSDAARDIKELIAVSSAQVSDGVRLVNATGDALGGLVEALQAVSSTIDDIAGASKEQATGMHEITSAVSHMDEATQRNAALAEESARAAIQLRAQSDTLAELLGVFRAGPADKSRSAA